MYDAAAVETRGKPVVVLANTGFVNDAESASRAKGFPGIRVVPTTVPCEGTIKEDIEGGIDRAMDAIVDAILKPLSPQETSPKAKEPENPARIIFKGSLQDVNRFYYQRGWTDGLPIIPPTEEAVAEMLQGTDLPPDHLLGKLQSRGGKATIEKIAINAVMAGCLPTYLPVLIAGTIDLLESEQGFHGYTTFGFSTGSWSPFWIINGPIRKQINVNNSSGALSPGNIANAAIGRAMGLIIKNIGGVRKGVEDMGVMGNPMKYTMVISENEEDSPWEPLHVQYGYQPEDSTIRVSFPNSYVQAIPFHAEADGILDAIVASTLFGMRYTYIITPTHAKNLVRAGYSKQKAKEYIAEHKNAQTPNFIETMTGNNPLPPGRPSLRRMIQDSSLIDIIVAGGPGAFMALITGGGATPGRKEIQKIDLPKNWDALVKKYKNIVPTYAKY